MTAQLSERQKNKIDVDLWRSAEYGHLEKVKQALQKGANFKCRFNIRDGKGRYLTLTTPHTVAYVNAHNTIVEFLESVGATPDYDEIMLAAAVRGLVDMVKEAIEKNADINDQHLDKVGDTALHLASGNGHTKLVQFLLLSNADPNICNKYGKTPAHIAVQEGHVDALKLLIEVGQVDVNATDKDHSTALYYASSNGDIEIVQFLLQSNADPNIYNKWGQSPLHLAYWKGHDNIVHLLCSVEARNRDQVRNDALLLTSAENGDIENVTLALGSGANINVHHYEFQVTALHLASTLGHCDIVQLLLDSNADPNVYDKLKQTSAHYAAEKGHVGVLKLLIEVSQADVNAIDKYGDSLLHLACANGKVDVISYLLHTGKVNPLYCNRLRKTPLEEVRLNDPNRFEILKMFEPFEKSCHDYPVDSYRKVFLCGNMTAGKSSLAQCIIYRADKPADYHYNPSQCIEGVQLETAGINYHNIRSHEVGNVILYDFAGHQEYYSSHAAVLENLMLRTPAVFIIVIDSTKGFDYFENQLYYWSNFIENICANLTKPSQVIVVGSFADQFTNSHDEFKLRVNYVVKDAIHKQKYRSFVAMDCHCPGGKGFPEFILHLRESCKAVLDKCDSISYYCHVHYAYLQKLQKVAISLKELIESLKDLNDPSLPSDETILLDYLSVLSDKGLVLFLRNKIVSNSWIVVKKSFLLAEVNGVLFNKNIKHLPIPTSSNTGIVHLSVLQKLFPTYDTSMLIDFLICMEFCHVIDLDTLNTITTNLSSSDKFSDLEVLFFPALVTTEPPSNLNEHFQNGFGWCLYCPNSFQFLSVRFLHVLLLRLAYLYSLPRHRKLGELDKRSPIQQLNRRCTVWKNGIFWKHRNDVVVEVTDDNRCVTVFVSNVNEVESQKMCCSIIKLILSLQKQLCPCIIEEYIIPPGSLADIRCKAISERILYKVNDVARGMLVNEEIFDHNEVHDSSINVKYICPHEPYISLAPAVIHALFSDAKTNEVIPDKFLQHIQEFVPSIISSYNTSKGSTYSDVSNQLNDYSFFTGQNPLVLSSPCLTQNEIIEVSKNRLQSTNISSLKETCPEKCDLLKLMSDIAFKWNIIGECLGIKYVYLASLQSKTSKDIEKLAEVLQLWMDTMPKPVTWNTILQTIESPPIETKFVVIEIEKFLKAKTKGCGDICDDDLLELLTTTESTKRVSIVTRYLKKQNTFNAKICGQGTVQQAYQINNFYVGGWCAVSVIVATIAIVIWYYYFMSIQL